MRVTYAFSLNPNKRLTIDEETIPAIGTIITFDEDKWKGDFRVASVLPPGALGGRRDEWIIRMERHI